MVYYYISKGYRQNIGAQQSQNRKRPEHHPLPVNTALSHDLRPSLQLQTVTSGNNATDPVTSQRERAHSTFHHVQEVSLFAVNTFFHSPNPN